MTAVNWTRPSFRWVAVLTAALMAASLVGCGSGVLEGRGGGGRGGNNPRQSGDGGVYSGGGGAGGNGSSTGGNNTGGSPSTGGSPGSPSINGVPLPQLWVHGAPKTPHMIVPLNAQGGRMFIDLRRFEGTEARNYLRDYIDNDLGICLTLRWMDPENKDAPDIAPTPAEARRQTDALMAVLTSPESKQLEGRIWVQFFNEFTGGPGLIKPEEADVMFGWATETALRIRKEAPHVLLCGPALTGLEVFWKNEGELTSVGKSRLAGLRRGIEWSARYAEAIDLHLHRADGQETREWIAMLRKQLNTYPGGEQTYILAWEWSPARYPNTKDLTGAMAALNDIYRAMAEAHFPIASYACFYPAYAVGPIFHWQSIALLPEKPGEQPKPNQPFWDTLTAIGAGRIDVPALKSSTNLNPSIPVTEVRKAKPVI